MGGARSSQDVQFEIAGIQTLKRPQIDKIKVNVRLQAAELEQVRGENARQTWATSRPTVDYRANMDHLRLFEAAFSIHRPCPVRSRLGVGLGCASRSKARPLQRDCLLYSTALSGTKVGWPWVRFTSRGRHLFSPSLPGSTPWVSFTSRSKVNLHTTVVVLFYMSSRESSQSPFIK